MMEAIPDLCSGLRVVAALRTATPAPCRGTRRWWDGNLDVEGLALGSVRAAATALTALTGGTAEYSVTSAGTAAAFNSLMHLRIDGRTPEGFAPLSGFRRTSDGFIRLHANYPHHAARLLEALSATDADGVERALLHLTSCEAEDAIAATGGVAAAVRARDEWVGTEMHAAAASGPWISFTAPGQATTVSGSPWRPSKDPARPLTGLRVLDFTRVIAGPTATRLLGALGADVLRIDPPGLPELPDAFIDSGFDKRSAVADLGDAGVRTAVSNLLQTADVVITGYRNGGLDRFGLGSEALLAARPGLIVGVLTAWGAAGPWSRRRGFDSLVQAASGIAHRYGREGDSGWMPGVLPVQALDHATGYGLAAGILALLTERLSTGAGGAVLLSLARTAEELFRLPTASSNARREALASPDCLETRSAYGKLGFVGPPLLVNDAPLHYAQPPVRYGSSALSWQ